MGHISGPAVQRGRSEPHCGSHARSHSRCQRGSSSGPQGSQLSAPTRKRAKTRHRLLWRCFPLSLGSLFVSCQHNDDRVRWICSTRHVRRDSRGLCEGIPCHHHIQTAGRANIFRASLRLMPRAYPTSRDFVTIVPPIAGRTFQLHQSWLRNWQHHHPHWETST